MEKKEFRDYIKSKLKSYGFQSRKSTFYKLIDDTFLVGFRLEASSYGGGYHLIFGTLILPDEIKWPFCGYFDNSIQLFFPRAGAEINEESFPCGIEWARTCNYPYLTEEQLDLVLQLNYEHFIKPRIAKESMLSLYRNNWLLMRIMSPYGIKKICALIGEDPYVVAEAIDRDLDFVPEE